MSLASVVGKRAVMGHFARSATRRAAVAVGSTSGPHVVAMTHQRKASLSTLSGGALLTQMAKDNPYKDVVRYEHKNRKWNLHHVDFYSEGLAIGLLENGLQPGDVVLSWLPPHFSESVSGMEGYLPVWSLLTSTAHLPISAADGSLCLLLPNELLRL